MDLHRDFKLLWLVIMLRIALNMLFKSQFEVDWINHCIILIQHLHLHTYKHDYSRFYFVV